MKNSLKKWLVSIALMAIIINVFSGFNLTVNADELNTETTEVTQTETVAPEVSKEETPVSETEEPTKTEVEVPETEEGTDPEGKVENETTNKDNEEDKNTPKNEEEPKDEPKMGKVEVYCYAGNHFLGSETLEDEVGSNYKIEVKDFAGYKYVGNAKLEGKFTEDTKEIFLEYVSESIFINIDLEIKDNNNSENLRPEKITVKLFRDGTQIDEMTGTVDTSNNYLQFDFDNEYPRFDENGKKYNYSVTVEGFSKEYYVNMDGSYGWRGNVEIFSVSASLVLENWDIFVGKQFGYPHRRNKLTNFDVKTEIPSEVTVHLLRNGEEVAGSPFKLSNKNDWHTIFKDMPRFDGNGKEYEYTVVEKPVKGYYSEIYKDIYSEEGKGLMVFTVINLLSKDVTATKVWDGGPEVKPDITFQLYQVDKYDENSEAVPYGEPVVLKSGTTSYTWENIPAGEEDEYEYFVEEVNVPEDYEVSYSEDKLTVTNTFTGEVSVETVGVEGTKTWDDNNDEAGKRPESITVNLLENGTKIDSVEVTAEDNWKYSFKDLPIEKDGEEVVYTVTEDEVEGYTMNIVDYNITNTYIKEVPVDPEETRVIEGTKTWDDNKDKAGKRPKSITVNLMANGEQIESRVVTKKDDWKYSFKNLPIEKDGKKIVYTLSEDTVKGYKPSFDGANITNKYVGKVEKNKLPKTGTVALTGITALGVALVALGGYTTFKKKK